MDDLLERARYHYFASPWGYIVCGALAEANFHQRQGFSINPPPIWTQIIPKRVRQRVPKFWVYKEPGPFLWPIVSAFFQRQSLVQLTTRLTDFKSPFVFTSCSLALFRIYCYCYHNLYWTSCHHHVIRPKSSPFAFLQPSSPPSGSLHNYFTKSFIPISPNDTRP